MHAKYKAISEMMARANDRFCEKHTSMDIVLGIIDKALRRQGMQADALSFDCVPLKKKMVFLLHDDKALTIDIALGNAQGEIFSSFQQQIELLSEQYFFDLMEEYFIQ